MKKLLILLTIVTFINCEHIESPISFSALDITYSSGWSKNYSVKITNTGDVVMQRGRGRKLFYKGQLNQQELRKLDSLYSTIPFEKYDSAYIDEDGFDLASYKIITSGNKSTGVYVYGTRKVPPALRNLMEYIQGIERNIKLAPADTVVSFRSEKDFYPPSPPLKSN